MSTITYYVYVSDAKVDMLFAQIPRPVKKRIAAELKFDLKVVGLSLKQNPSDETRYSKVKFVSEYVDKHLEVGTLDQPRAYFRGELGVRGRLVCPVPEFWRRIGSSETTSSPSPGPPRGSCLWSTVRCGRDRCCGTGGGARGPAADRCTWG
jgi:hypothetical protein